MDEEWGGAIPGWGVDREPWQRPGVPMLRDPKPAPGSHIDPAAQVPCVKVLRRRELDRLTTVFGSGQPPRGISGVLRRFAYRVPEHRARRWLLLLFADRVDVLEHRLATPGAIAAVSVAVAAGLVLARQGWRRA